MKCGRELNGEKSHEQGVCPATLPTEFDGVHNGKASGRFCWTVTGTLCKGRPSGAFSQKFMNCLDCNFFKYVQDQEGRNFRITPKQAKENMKNYLQHYKIQRDKTE